MVAVRAAESKKATEIKVLDLTELDTFTDHFIVCTGANSKQMSAIAEGVSLRLKKQGQLPINVEGKDGSDWVLCDYGDFVVHIFSPKSREYYDLERLWKQGRVIAVPAA